MNGTITRRARKGSTKPSWGYVFDAGTIEDGKRKQVTKSGFTTKKEAEDALRKAIGEVEEKQRRAGELSAEELAEAIAEFKAKRAAPVREQRTFGEFFDRWMKEHAARRCSPKTLEAYGQHGAYAKREFGSVLLKDLSAEVLETAMNRLKDGGGRNGRALSARSIGHIFFVVNAVLSKAVKWKLIDDNCMEQVDRPKRTAKAAPRVLDSDGMTKLLSCAANTRLYPLLVLAAATGCRRGELLALTWSDLDVKGTLLVSKSLEETREGLRVKSTKSNKARLLPRTRGCSLSPSPALSTTGAGPGDVRSGLPGQ